MVVSYMFESGRLIQISKANWSIIFYKFLGFIPDKQIVVLYV
jgi:hypothetical protein